MQTDNELCAMSPGREGVHVQVIPRRETALWRCQGGPQGAQCKLTLEGLQNE